MTRTAKRLPDSLLNQIYQTITPPRWAGEEDIHFNIGPQKKFDNKLDALCVLLTTIIVKQCIDWYFHRD